MVNKTRKAKRVSKRVLEMRNDPTTVWGKNPKLESFWRDLSSGKCVVLVYKNGTHTYLEMPNITTKKYQEIMN